MSTRIEGIIDRLTDAETFDDIKWIVGDGIVRNYAQSIVDDHIKANAEFQGKAGLEVTVERVSVGKTCKWCLARCGKFTYPNVPDGTWDRHVDCDCYIIYNNGRVKQTLKGTDKKWNVVSEEELSERKKVGLTKPTEKVLETRKIVGLEDENKLRDGLGAEYYDKMQSMVAGSTDETAKAAWEQVHKKIAVAETKARGREHQCRGQIYVNVEKNAAGSMSYKPYETIFHESGHAIDWIRASDGNGAGSFLSTTYKNGVFRDTIIEEANAIVDKKAKIVKELYAKEDWDALNKVGAISDYELERFKQDGKWLFGEPKYSKAKAYEAVSEDLMRMSTFKGGDVSDIMEGATKAKVQGTMGHGKRYWSRGEQLLPTEAFAEFTSATFSNPESLETLKEWFPKSYEIWHAMLDEIIASGF